MSAPRRSAAAVLLTGLVGLAGCSGNGRPAPDPSTNQSAVSDESLLAAVREYGECMRAHGVAAFQDPRVDNHRLVGGGVPVGGVDEATMAAAELACEAISDRIPASAWGGFTPSTEDLDRMRRFSVCMRENGFPDWPDPDSNGLFAVPEQVLRTDQNKEAQQTCKRYFDGRIKTAGGGR